ncbi:ras-like protein family member 12 isoform X2 [Carassius carassius]|uniref:ras-like protein family member 12 isoform X2 n=1 Tax=Carassius carassius TaxID=217509 RepID=UPI0028694946|nr:ras-like protein family member 12 isoform X2 [Carassius carassius]
MRNRTSSASSRMSLMFGKARTCNIVTVPEHEPSESNIVILGAMGSGKSALTVKFLTKRFISEYDPNLDTYSTEEVVDQQPVLVKVMDTADQDGPVNCERYLSWANAFIVVYSIDNRTSFEACQQYLETVTLYSKGLQPEAPVILLGNKVDMERYRQVSKADGVALALRFSCLFFEVSACLDFLSVQHVFHEAIREVRRETERSIRPLFISEDKSAISLSSAPPLTACYKELPTPATAKLVTVKSSRAQSKRRAPTLTLLKGFKIF